MTTMLASSNNYKNSLKKLRKIKPSFIREREKQSVGNYFSFLLEEQNQYQEPEQQQEQEQKDKEQQEYKKIVREKSGNIDFNDLPEDTIYKILTFLSANTRLAILKHKYNKNFIKSMLQRIPETNESLTKLWKCAKIAFHILENTLNEDNKLINGMSSYPIRFFKEENDPKNFAIYYKGQFTEIILAATRHYSRIYKYGHYTSKKVIEHMEQIMLNIFAHLTMMK
jgi:hypothetical protein